MFYEAGLQSIRVTAAVSALRRQVGLGRSSNWTIKFENTARVLARLTGDTERWRAFSDGFMERRHQEDLFYFCTVIQVSGRIPTEHTLKAPRTHRVV